MEKRLSVFLLPLLLADCVCAEAPVYFADETLKAAVEEELWISDPTPADMLALTQLWCDKQRIHDLSGLEYATNLQVLSIKANRGALHSLSPLAGLTSLQSLTAEENSIDDISVLSGLTNLRELMLEVNCISDISALSALTNLERVSLHRNQVYDISPLASLTALQWVDLRMNPLNEFAYGLYIPQIKANNPDVLVAFDPVFGRRLSISSSAGGAVTQPGEGEFVYEYGEVVALEATPDPGFVFVKWSGTYCVPRNPLLLSLNEDHQLRANFLTTRGVVYVDDDSPDDPAPGDLAWSDPNDDGTLEHPFDSIQEAVDVAPDGSAVFVLAGTYREAVEFRGRNIRVRGFCREDVNEGGWPVIGGDEGRPAVTFTNSESPDCILSGFVIAGGKGTSAGAILCAGSSPTIVNCLITGNRAADWNGGAVRCSDSSAVFANCTITGNQAGQYGAALYLENSPVVAINSILWGNAPRDILTEDVTQPQIRSSIIGGGWQGPGSLNTDPIFASLGHWADRSNPGVTIQTSDPDAIWVMGDYHVQSQAGRWDPETHGWQQDEVTSPCVDAGDPATPVGGEPLPNGGIVNLGVYGGTAEASKSRSNAPSP